MLRNLIAVFIQTYFCYQLRTKCYTKFVCWLSLDMRKKYEGMSLWIPTSQIGCLSSTLCSSDTGNVNTYTLFLTSTGKEPRDGRFGVRFPVKSRDFFLLHSVQILSGTHAASCLMDTGVPSWCYSSWAVNLTNHIYPVSRLRTCGALPLPLLYATMF
jgi:hypothetical protein